LEVIDYDKENFESFKGAVKLVLVGVCEGVLG